MGNKATYIGDVQNVDGTTVSVSLSSNCTSGLTYVNGEGYKIGQVGSFVKIPLGYNDLFGIVAQIGANAVPENQIENQPYGNRWMTIQLIGEGQQNGHFERGISQYPTIGDEVHLVSEDDLKHIYGHIEKPYFVNVGHIAGAESIPALIDINKLITRHSAIVGTTGSGKSTTVAGILNALSIPEKYPSSRIIVLDIHGEYANALENRANVYKINANNKKGENELYLPFWALSFDELVEISFGAINGEKEKVLILEKILKSKEESLAKYPKEGINNETLNVDSPIPFSLNQLWYNLYTETIGTYYSNNKTHSGKPIDNLAYEKNDAEEEIKGDPSKGIAPQFRKPKNDKDDDEKINYLPQPTVLNISSQLMSLGSKLRIPRFDFLFNPGEWTPDLGGKTEKDLDELFKEWIGSEKPITIFDLSGVPSSILNTIIGVLMRMLYEALFWTRNLSQGGKQRPLLIVMEEAHNYLNDNFNGSASIVVQRIVKEGRKYGIGAMIVSQRPSEINSTILSQCGTFIALRLSNSTDRGHICSAVTFDKYASDIKNRRSYNFRRSS
jgi:energy-coupling factor transporter ATP-binding protein EcfA2